MNTFNQRVDDENHKDLDLLAGCANGSQSCFTELYRRHYQSMARVAYRYIGSSELSEDVLHEAMITIWKKAADFEGRSRVKTWMLGIVVFKARELKRSQAKEVPQYASDIELDAIAADSASLSTRHDIQLALGELSDDHRTCIELAYFAGLNHREIGQVMACPVNTVKTRVHFAKKYLREFLESTGQDEAVNKESSTFGNKLS